jgi:hypothetical protein
MSVNLSPLAGAGQQFFDNNGVILSGGKLYSYVAGTTTPQATYTSASGSTPHTNPIILNSAGRVATGEIWLTAGENYKFSLFTSTDVLIATWDNITGINGTGITSNASTVVYDPAGTGAVATTVQAKLRESVSVKDFGAVGDGVTDDTVAIQAAIDSSSVGMQVFLPAGTYKITDTIYLRRTGVHIVGAGLNATYVQFVNAAGGTAFTGDTDKELSLLTYNYCELRDFTIGSVAAATDASICVDITSFSYSHFNLSVTTKRTNGICYYGQGNAGASPYYNHIEGYFFGGDGAGGTAYTQTGISFAQGLLGTATAGSNGPNANIIGPIGRAAALATMVDMKAGNGNHFSNINGESILDYYFILNNNAAVDSGTSSGSNTQNTLKDTAKSWTTNAYSNAAVKITAGTGSGQIRKLSNNTATSATLVTAWGVVPDATSTYEIYAGKTVGNDFTHIRTEGLATSNPDFIYALPGTGICNACLNYVGSLGTGLYIRDDSGDIANKWFSNQRILFTENIQNPGAGANINVYVKNSVFGGVAPMGSYVVDYLAVSTSTATLSDTLTVTLDVGGVTVGTGSPSLVAVLPTGNTFGFAMSVGAEKTPVASTSSRIFLNVTTGGSFSATADIQITWGLTVI